MLNPIFVLSLVIASAVANGIDLGNYTQPGVARALTSTCSITKPETTFQATFQTNQLLTESYTCGKLELLISQSGTPAQITLAINAPRGPTGTKRFYIHTLDKLNWYRANHFCEAEGYRLASFNSLAETNQAIDLITQAGFHLPDQRFWTAGTRLGYDTTFYWMGDDRPWSYTNWASGEPNNSGGQEACVEFSANAIRGWAWNDAPCDSQFYLLCEEELLTQQLKKDA